MRILKTDAQLLKAALTQARVTVREYDGRIVDYGGPIERYSENSVRIMGAYYMRSQFNFTTEVKRKWT